MSYPIDMVADQDQFLELVQSNVDILDDRGVFAMVNGILPLVPPTHTVIVGDEHYMKSILPNQPYLVFSLNTDRLYRGNDKFFDMICWYDGVYRTTTIKYTNTQIDTVIFDVYHQLSADQQKLFIDGKLSIALHITSGHITCILS